MRRWELGTRYVLPGIPHMDSSWVVGMFSVAMKCIDAERTTLLLLLASN